MARDPSIARDVWRRLEILHGVTYFSPEATGAFTAAGYKGYWMGYFAGRAAPLGPVGPQVVTALFFNFAPSRVARALPDAWSFAPPSAALEARASGSQAALRRHLADVDADAVTTVAALARRAASAAPPEGRALFAANLALAWPDDPLGDLWHATTLLREHRGDGHVAVLTAAGIGGREANVLHAASVGTPREYLAIARDYGEEEWGALAEGLAARGLLSSDGALTDGGRVLKDELEDRTDRLALAAFATLADDELTALFDGLTPLAQAVLASGEVPAVTPIGQLGEPLLARR